MYYKYANEGYILAVGTGGMGEVITDDEYEEIMAVIQNRPSDTDTIGYRLTTELTWEQYEKEPVGEEEPTAEELLSILTGESE